ncbi:HNH endonuclease family protein [Lacisediminihabitans profunda]|uniref:HNH endonuclease n=1 Tax=Lacisediminihabitans profunda TaxID=2594790 RepID=A0A5C8UVA8_9MICO|nr:HNH endonuclease family protein [Lacisediminihabitans profunda]TXN31939.1 HNH endonuclease [Lacisediminihabitans profunda]
MPDSSEPVHVSRYFTRPRFWVLVVAASVFAAIVGGALVPAAHRADSAARTGASASTQSRFGSATTGTALVAIADSSSTDTTALALLATLPVKGKSPMTGYTRTVMFGAAWIDQDRNGCDTRNDILSRDLVKVVKSGSCRVLSGKLVSPYTGKTIDFVRGNRTSTAVQIDHVVSLGDAWRTGAQRLSQGQRVALANDPINLFAVDGRSNEQKSDGDTATWLPAAKAFRCEYVSHQVSVKATYGLWVTPAEHAAMLRVLSACPAEAAVSSPFASAPAPAPVPPAPVAPAPAPAPAGVVHPGAFCSTAGATGVTVKGAAMRCTTTPTDPRLRWRAA